MRCQSGKRTLARTGLGGGKNSSTDWTGGGGGELYHGLDWGGEELYHGMDWRGGGGGWRTLPRTGRGATHGVFGSAMRLHSDGVLRTWVQLNLKTMNSIFRGGNFKAGNNSGWADWNICKRWRGQCHQGETSCAALGQQGRFPEIKPLPIRGSILWKSKFTKRQKA